MICSSVHTKLATPNPRAASATIGYKTSGPGPWYVAHPRRSAPTSGILRPVADEGERYNIGGAKIDLYHVVLSGGLLMLGLGAILTAAAWVRVRVHREKTPTAGGPVRDAPRDSSL